MTGKVTQALEEGAEKLAKALGEDAGRRCRTSTTTPETG
jgi:hypothetical protein